MRSHLGENSLKLQLLTGLRTRRSGIRIAQNGPCREKSIKDQLAEQDSGSTLADDIYFCSRAFEKPVIGKAGLDESSKAVGAKRKTEKHENNMERTVISPNGDWSTNMVLRT